ncbi:PREDICTED: uncharacterized protein LOC106149548 [Chinchilla lanigera]|uniref:uncharacterized protein LOC106149548 n=1 Tax=Chinchilla lanigera TaxID=34839 RepID=UPI000697C184|nr:PREDICTED: uncharacterized protein LOC106149548 [Chinchilla lanigera]
MGLTIKGQRIPDVAEPLEGVRESGRRLEQGRSGTAAAATGARGTAGSGAEAGQGPGEAQPRPGPQPPGPGGSQLVLRERSTPHPRSQGGIWSSEPASPQRCHLPQGSLACGSLAGKEHGRCWLYLISRRSRPRRRRVPFCGVPSLPTPRHLALGAWALLLPKSRQKLQGLMVVCSSGNEEATQLSSTPLNKCVKHVPASGDRVGQGGSWDLCWRGPPRGEWRLRDPRQLCLGLGRPPVSSERRKRGKEHASRHPPDEPGNLCLCLKTFPNKSLRRL